MREKVLLTGQEKWIYNCLWERNLIRKDLSFLRDHFFDKVALGKGVSKSRLLKKTTTNFQETLVSQPAFSQWIQIPSETKSKPNHSSTIGDEFQFFLLSWPQILSFADVHLYCIYADILGGWVRKRTKICWRNIGMVPIS